MLFKAIVNDIFSFNGIIARKHHNILLYISIIKIYTFIGFPDPILNLTTTAHTSGIVSISWDAPFHYDVPRTNPDLTYCVTIWNTTKSQASLSYSKCNINVTVYSCESFPVLLACGAYKLEVLASNVLGNSTTTTELVQYPGTY